MAKSHLHLEKTPSNSRRAFLKSSVAATAALALAQSATAAPLEAGPSEEGRAILKMIAAQRTAMAKASAYEEADDEASAETWNDRWLAIADQIEAPGLEINSRPIKSLPDVIDRAILAAYDCSAAGGELQVREDGQMIVSLIEGLIVLSGLSAVECNFEI
jgi:hypothetical protein